MKLSLAFLLCTLRSALLMTASLLLAGGALAGSSSGGSWYTSYGDEGYYEHFAGAVEDYNGTGNSNLGLCIDGVNEMRGHLSNVGYSNYRIFTDSSVWATEYESGADWIYADGGDLAYFSGHGGSGLFVMNGSGGDDMLWWGETKWGDRDGHSNWQTGAYMRFTSSSCNTAWDTATSFSCDPTSGVTKASSRCSASS